MKGMGWKMNWKKQGKEWKEEKKKEGPGDGIVSLNGVEDAKAMLLLTATLPSPP